MSFDLKITHLFLSWSYECTVNAQSQAWLVANQLNSINFKFNQSVISSSSTPSTSEFEKGKWEVFMQIKQIIIFIFLIKIEDMLIS